MRGILMSIRPEWCEKIFNGEKTIEVRKTAPTTIIRLFETPFMVYVYQTKHKGKSIVSEVLNSVYGGGKVIGSFVCDKVRSYIPCWGRCCGWTMIKEMTNNGIKRINEKNA